jgi:hypothetical protein
MELRLDSFLTLALDGDKLGDSHSCHCTPAKGLPVLFCLACTLVTARTEITRSEYCTSVLEVKRLGDRRLQERRYGQIYVNLAGLCF